MKIFRYEAEGGAIKWGTEAADGRVLEAEGDLFEGLTATERPAGVVRLLAPLVPAQIIGIGLNYRRHAVESGMAVPEQPVVFWKGLNALCHPGDPIRLPRKRLVSDAVDYECELAVVIGKTCRDASVEDALTYVLGYTLGNDVSARDWQIKKGGGQWSRGKSFDTFCPLGPAIVTADAVPDPARLEIFTELNGTVVQRESVSDMIFTVAELISFLSASTTLPAGTVILTGTPQGVGMATGRYLRAGDIVTVGEATLGRLTNSVEEEAP